MNFLRSTFLLRTHLLLFVCYLTLTLASIKRKLLMHMESIRTTLEGVAAWHEPPVDSRLGQAQQRTPCMNLPFLRGEGTLPTRIQVAKRNASEIIAASTPPHIVMSPELVDQTTEELLFKGHGGLLQLCKGKHSHTNFGACLFYIGGRIWISG